MNETDSFGSFSYWYKLLVHNKMGSPALSIAGLAVGFLLVELTRAVPAPYDKHIGSLGLRIMDVSAIILMSTTAGFAFLWLRSAAKRRSWF